MKKSLIPLLLFLFSCSQHRQPDDGWLSLTDDIGRKVTFDEPPARVISLAPSLSEICFAIDSGATLVGVTDYCNYPSGTKDKQSVGGMVSPNFEKIADLNPDLILVTVEGNSKEDFSKLESLGYNLFVVNPRTVDDIYQSLLTLGKILRRDSAAVRLVESVRRKEEHIRSLVRGETKPKVFVIISIKPLMTAGPTTFIHQLVVRAGGVNIAEDAELPYPIFNREEVLHQRPDYLVVTTDAVHSLGSLFAEFPEWEKLSSVKQRKVLFVNSDIVTRPGPRIVEGLEILARVFHPSKFQRTPGTGDSLQSLQIGTR